MKKGVKDSEFDFYRWLSYGLSLLVLALAAIFLPGLLWAFVILLIIAVIDISYCQFFKYRFFAKKM